MTQWEYLTLFLEAKVRKGDDELLSRRFNKKKLPQYTPERLIPELDQLGEAGWELIHMEPVAKVGRKGDILFGGVTRWSNTYFCVFKRLKQAAAPQPQPAPPRQQIAQPPERPPAPQPLPPQADDSASGD